MTGSSVLRVAVLSPHALIRAGVAAVLARAPERVDVVEARADHDVTVYDLAGLPRRHGGDLTDRIASGPALLGLSREGEDDLAAGARALGVRHLVRDRAPAAELLAAVREAARWTAEPGEVIDWRLSGRELEVLRLIGAGLSNRQIAQQEYLSINTVKTYVRGAYRKIGATKRPDAVLWTQRHGLGPVEPAVVS